MPATAPALAVPRQPQPLLMALPLALLLLLIPVLARAHDGAHQHPHGVELSWVLVAGMIGAAGGWAVARWRGRR